MPLPAGTGDCPEDTTARLLGRGLAPRDRVVVQRPHSVECAVAHLIDGFDELIALLRSPQIAGFKLCRRLKVASEPPVRPVGKIFKRPLRAAVALQLPQEQGP